MKDVMSKEEVAAVLGCEPETVEDKARERELPGVKYGRSWIFPRTALLECLHLKALENMKPAPSKPTARALRTSKRTPPALPALQ